MDLLSAERRIDHLSKVIETINRWVINSAGVSEEALRAFVDDVGKLLNEKRDLLLRVNKSKAINKFDSTMSILEAECYIKSIAEMAKVNENVAFGLSKFVLGGVINSTDADVVRLYKESSTMIASVFEIEERLRAVKTKTGV